MSVHRQQVAVARKEDTDMPASVLTVDQSLVDNYLSRVERFAHNIQNFKETLDSLLKPSEPAVSEMAESVQQTRQSGVVTADDIDINALINGIDLTGMTL